MSRKTFIKVRPGILTPAHHANIGEAIWLYLYILNRADWDTGKIYDWRDNDAAEDLGIYIGTIRNYRKKLMGEYIEFVEHGRWSEVTIKKWVDPRTKSSDLDNSADDIPDNVPDNMPNNQLSDTDGVRDKVLDNMRDNMPDNTLSPLHIVKNTDIRVQNKYIATEPTQISETQRLLESLTGIPPANAADVDAIREIEMMNPTEQDIRAAISWVQTRGVKRIKRYTSLVNPVSVCMSNRVNKPKTTLDKSKEAILKAMAEMKNEEVSSGIF